MKPCKCIALVGNGHFPWSSSQGRVSDIKDTGQLIGFCGLYQVTWYTHRNPVWDSSWEYYLAVYTNLVSGSQMYNKQSSIYYQISSHYKEESGKISPITYLCLDPLLKGMHGRYGTNFLLVSTKVSLHMLMLSQPSQPKAYTVPMRAT